MPSRRSFAASRLAPLAVAAALVACGGGGGGAPPPPPGGAACGAVYASCTGPAACCSGSCTGGACDCSPLAARCSTSDDCCTSTSARTCSGGVCVAGCRANGDVCRSGLDCCSGSCDTSGHCGPPCVGYGATCSSSGQCCAYLGCPAGTCATSCQTSGACTTSNACCSGYGCRAGSCQSGACGTLGQSCDAAADCCSYAQSGKNYVCDLSGGGAHGTCTLAQPFEACATDADCAGADPCRGGYCHYPDASRSDGWSCLDGRECQSGLCSATSPGVPGTCCSGAGTSCVAGGGSTACCAPLTCVGAPGSQVCAGCLGPDNSGAGHPYQCAYTSQCCSGAGLTCEASTGACCKANGTACVAGSECCSGETCGDVTTYQGTTAGVCCGDFQGWCGLYSPCCDGYVCSNAGQSYPATCLKAPGQPCQATSECTDLAGCKIATPPTGTCCLHESGTCTRDSDCCTGLCDATTHSCQYAPPYGQCLADGDCQWMLNSSFSGTRCGGNATVGPLRCCPAPGQACQSATDCCEAGDACAPALAPDYTGTTAPVCCRATQQTCAQDYECCTGSCGYQGTLGSACCAYPWMTTFTCAADQDCCDWASSTGSMCDTTSHRCCWKAGQTVGAGNAALCCSGRYDSFYTCR